MRPLSFIVFTSSISTFGSPRECLGLRGAASDAAALFAILLVMLVVQARHLRDRLTTPASTALAALLIYVVVSIPMASWPGSVVRNLEPYVRASRWRFFIFHRSGRR